MTRVDSIHAVGAGASEAWLCVVTAQFTAQEPRQPRLCHAKIRVSGAWPRHMKKVQVRG
jgi:hypothetical protein